MWRAVGDVVSHAAAAVGLKVPRAVVPQANVVEILDAKGGFDGGGCIVKKFVCQSVRRKVQR